MLTTNEKSKLVLSFKEKSFNQLTEPKLTLIEEANYQLSNIQSQHLYITSNDPIQEGNWITDGKRIAQVNCLTINDPNKHLYKKIIATTDTSLKINKFDSGVFKDLKYSLPSPSQEFIEKYIEEYNKGYQIVEVLVQYEEVNDFGEPYSFDDVDFGIEKEYKLKLKDNTISIFKVKDNYSRDEVSNLLTRAWIHGQANPNCHYTIREKWIEENL